MFFELERYQSSSARIKIPHGIVVHNGTVYQYWLPQNSLARKFKKIGTINNLELLTQEIQFLITHGPSHTPTAATTHIKAEIVYSVKYWEHPSSKRMFTLASFGHTIKDPLTEQAKHLIDLLDFAYAGAFM